MANNNTAEQQAKDTGMAFILICLIVFLFTHQLVWIYAAVVFLLICMICPALYRPASRIWFKFSRVIGDIVSKILLSIIFYTVLTPIGLLRQLTGADAMKQKKWKTPESAFKKRDVNFSAADLKKPY